jgi:hypothetical protein
MEGPLLITGATPASQPSLEGQLVVHKALGRRVRCIDECLLTRKGSSAGRREARGLRFPDVSHHPFL